MLLLNNCSGHCYTCSCEGNCLAGHGDNDYSPATIHQIKERINKEIDCIQNHINNQINKENMNTLIHSCNKLKILTDFLINNI